MKKIIVVCAGGFGREVFEMIERINEKAIQAGETPPYDLLGFIDDYVKELNKKQSNYRILGTIKDWTPSNDEVYALGISNPKSKEKIASLLKEKGASFETLISPGCQLSKSVTLGEGCIITGFDVGQDVAIGDYVNVMGAMIGQDSVIGDYSTITGFANIAAATIGKRVFVGSHAVILNDRKIGDDAFVCASSLVVHNIKAGYKVFGVPARKVDW